MVIMSRMTANRGSTAADVLNANRGVGPGFDALRLLLSVWVFVLHAIAVCNGAEFAGEFAANPLHRIVITPVLPMFFAVSGYLVTGSPIRTGSTSTFLMFRALRIAPALIVDDLSP
jgi:peptidoglycan/LPS O-acetylase OafA/YrhL